MNYEVLVIQLSAPRSFFLFFMSECFTHHFILRGHELLFFQKFHSCIPADIIIVFKIVTFRLVIESIILQFCIHFMALLTAGSDPDG